MGYILTDGRGNYIRRDTQSNKYVRVNQMAYAVVFDALDKASRVRQCMLSKDLKRDFYVTETNMPVTTGIRQKVKAPEPPREEIRPEDEMIVGLLRHAETILSRREELSEKLSRADKEISDLQHYIEMKNLNACNGYKIYKKLQMVLVQRREVKNEMLMLSIISECKMEPDSISTTIARIKGLSDRKYTPRVLTDLFEKGVG